METPAIVFEYEEYRFYFGKRSRWNSESVSVLLFLISNWTHFCCCMCSDVFLIHFFLIRCCSGPVYGCVNGL